MRNSSVTQSDIARAAGVSARTVSNVLNDFKYVAPTTRQRVLLAMESLGYRPNAAAQALRAGRTNTLLLAVPLDAPYFIELANLIIEEAWKHGVLIVMRKIEFDPSREHQLNLESSKSHLFDGIIFATPGGVVEDELRQARPSEPVIVLCDGPLDHESYLDRMVFDEAAALGAVVDRLVELGRSRIAGLTQGSRQESLNKELAQRGLPTGLGRECLGTPLSGEEETTALIEDGVEFDALICQNDPAALGAVRSLSRHGRWVPEDVAVVGFDDNALGRASYPSLTTIAQDKGEVARWAVGRLLARIGGDTSPPVVVPVPWQLVERESTPNSP